MKILVWNLLKKTKFTLTLSLTLDLKFFTTCASLTAYKSCSVSCLDEAQLCLFKPSSLLRLLWPSASLARAAAAVLCILHSRMKRGCPLLTHTFPSTLYYLRGRPCLSAGFLLFSTLSLSLSSSSSALAQGVRAAITAVSASLSGGALRNSL